MSILTGGHSATDLARERKFGPLYSRNAKAVVARGLMAAKSSTWLVLLSGFFEPVLFLLAMGVGMGSIVGTVEGPGGTEISYAAYIAPALLAVSAMNGAIYDSTWNVFFKMNFAKLYQGMLYTSSVRWMLPWARFSWLCCADSSTPRASPRSWASWDC